MIPLGLILAFAASPHLQGPMVPGEPLTVLVVPTVNDSGDKYEAMKARQDSESDSTLHRLFSDHGFSVLLTDPVSPMRIHPRPPIGSASDEQEVLFGLGRDAHAQFVVFTEITGTKQMQIHKYLVVPAMAGCVTLKTWLLDIPNHKAILAGATAEAQSTALCESGSDRQTRAVRLALETQLKSFFQFARTGS